MSTWTSAARRIGMWSAVSVAVIDVIYVLTGVVWLISGGARSPEPLQPSEPFLAILEFLILLSAPALVAVMAAVHAYASLERKIYTLIALAFTVAFAVLTSGVHFIQLAVVRQMISRDVPGFFVIRLYPWPSVILALDFLAWDFFLGLAMLLGALIFTGGSKLQTAVRVCMLLSGALCLAGTLGPGLGDLRIQYMGIVGYAAVLPIACVLLAILFARTAPGTIPTRVDVQ